MSDTKHAPGEWLQIRGRNFHNDNAPVEIRKSTGGYGWSWGIANDDDVRVMLAAPELLEALQAVVRVADRKTIEFDKARAAIAKATGAAKEG